MGEVHLLACPPPDALTGGSLPRDLGVLPGEPRRHRVGGRPQDDGDPPPVRPVEHRLQPLEVEDPVLGLPRGPRRLTHPDHGEARLGHQVEVLIEPGRGLVLVVVRRAEEDGLGKLSHGTRGPFGRRGRGPGVGHCLTPPVARPDCQYRCRKRKTTISGMIETIEPVITIEKSAWDPDPAADVACHCARPTVSGQYSGLLSMISGRKYLFQVATSAKRCTVTN